MLNMVIENKQIHVWCSIFSGGGNRNNETTEKVRGTGVKAMGRYGDEEVCDITQPRTYTKAHVLTHGRTLLYWHAADLVL